MNRRTMRTSSFSGTSHRRPSSSATADPGREPSCPQGSRHGGGISRPRIARTHQGVYADRMYGSDILCSRELLSRGQSELQPLLIKHTDWTYSLRSSAPCDRFVRAAGSLNFRNLRFVPEKLAQKNPSDPAIQRSSVPAIQRSSDPTIQRSNDPTIQRSNVQNTPDFGPRPLCVLESCLLLSRQPITDRVLVLA